MFVIAILDMKTGNFHVVRDSIGVKPIYITKNENGIFGCSELKGLKSLVSDDFVVDIDCVYEFFNNGFLYEPSTGYKDVNKLLPGSMLTIDLSNGKHIYTKLISFSNHNNNDSLKSNIAEAIQNQSIADVPLGVFFSGGIDSSIIAKYAANSDLFFAEYADNPSSDIDKRYSKMIAGHLNSNMITHNLDDSNTNVEELIKQVKFVATHTEELISDYTFWSTYQLSQAANSNGYKVMLSGMGGDEVFAGYPRYHVLQNHFIFSFLGPFLKIIRKFNLFPKSLDKKFDRLVSYISEKYWPIAYSRLLGYFSRDDLSNLFNAKENSLYLEYKKKLESILKNFGGNYNDKVKVGQYLDLFGFLSHNLMVSDKASMLASIELRVPLLDEAIVDKGITEKSDCLINLKNTKIPLRNIFLELIPKRFLERPKTGFNPPLDSLINNIGKDRLTLELSQINSFISTKYAIQLVDNHFNKVENNTYKIWQLLYFKFWLENKL